MKELIKKICKALRINHHDLIEKIGFFSLKLALRENKYNELMATLRSVAPDISDQEESTKDSFNSFYEFKRRQLQAFQMNLVMARLQNEFQKNKDIVIVDIGDSAGTHMLYLKKLTEGNWQINSLSVNLDPRAIRKIESKGLKAILCRAEELDLHDIKPDLFVSFQMLEHLHNPALFFYRLTRKSSCNKFVITVPFVRSSRIALNSIRNKTMQKVFAEDEHIFELSPDDWKLLLQHAGWKTLSTKVYYQYPKNIFIISSLLSLFWRITDYEGFLGLSLEKDETFSNLYQDWEE
ncbi:MAG: hypothetical protein AB9903_29480 [Vulcanimicrobiota bacterium]